MVINFARKRGILLLLFLILFLGFSLRLYRINNPIADWHSWRQADTSAVSRNFVIHGFDLFHPTFDDISNVPSGKDNPNGYRFVEFPIYNSLHAGLFILFPFFTLEIWGRLVTISMSTFSALLLFLIVRRHADEFVALFSSAIFSFLPFSIYYGRTILPDPTMVTAVLASIYFFETWSRKHDGSLQVHAPGKNFLFFVLAAFFSAMSLLLKPYAIFFLLPIVVLAYQSFGVKMLFKWQLYLFVIMSVLPLVFWRIWMLQYPEGIPVSGWLFNAGNIRFKGAFFYWIFADRIARLILGYFGIVFLLLGVLSVTSKIFIKKKNDVLFFLAFLVSSLAYVTIIARGNVQHDYYQILILPTVAIFAGFGIAFLLRPFANLNKTVCFLLFFVCSVFTFFFAWYYIRDYFNINNPNIIIAGEAVDRLTPKDAKVVTFYDGDTSFLYQTKRKGWSSLQAPLPELVRLGASYLAIVNPTESDRWGFGKQYPVIASTQEYLILKLAK